MVAMILGLVAMGQAQVLWQTTHTDKAGGYNQGACALLNASLKVRVGPAFLDLEEDVEIGVKGAVTTGNDPKTLEIVGNFSMPSGSAITGGLLWDGGQILQGKLLDRATADSLYANLVERNSVPPARPRDPLILEKMSPGRFRFRIYPVALGYSRHFRLRYQIPATMTANGVQMSLFAPITSLFSSASFQVPVTLENGGNMPSIIFTTGMGVRTEMLLPKTKLCTPWELGNQASVWEAGQIIKQGGSIIQSVVPVRQVALKTTFVGGQMAGYFLNLYASLSADVLKGLNLPSAKNIDLTVRNEIKSYEIPITCSGGMTLGCGAMAFNAKSDRPWNDTLEWRSFDATGKLLALVKTRSNAYNVAQDTNAAVLWAAADSRFSEKKELPAGPVFGFVDEWASLLALPKDSVPASLVAHYALSGVPRLANYSIKDVIPNYAPGQVPFDPGNPGNPGSFPIVTKTQSLLSAKFGSFADASTWLMSRSPAGMSVLIPGLLPDLETTVELYSLSGKKVGSWSPRSASGSIGIDIAGLHTGVYWIKVRIEGKMMTKRIAI